MDRVTILNDGNVGIGAANPGYKLDVGSDARVQGWIYGGSGAEYSFYVPQANNTNGRWDIVEMSYDVANWQPAALEVEVDRIGYDNPQRTVFYIKKGYGNSLDYEVLYGGNIVGYWGSETVVTGNMRKATFSINYDNYYQYFVKVRVAAPNPFTVVSSITSGGQIHIVNAWNGTRLASTNSGNTLLAQNGGNVGIGTTGPKSALHVVGLPVYANNAAAVAGGLTVGAFYRTGADPDPVCVVH